MNIVEELRGLDFKQPELPFYYVQIGRHVDGRNTAEWNAVQAAQLKAEADLTNVGMVVSIDATLAWHAYPDSSVPLIK